MTHISGQHDAADLPTGSQVERDGVTVGRIIERTDQDPVMPWQTTDTRHGYTHQDIDIMLRRGTARVAQVGNDG